MISSENGKRSIQEQSASLIGGLLDENNPKNENDVRTRLGLTSVTESTVKEINTPQPGGYPRAGSVKYWPGAVNSNESGTLNEYLYFIPRIKK